MFGRNKRIEDLECREMALTDTMIDIQMSVNKLKDELGKAGLIDYRQEKTEKSNSVTYISVETKTANPVSEKINLLMDHLGLEMQTVKGKESYKKIKKAMKGKK